MDPLLWSTLPSELVEVVFAKFSIGKIMDLCALSTAWCTISKSSNFRRVFSDIHPKLFGLLGWREEKLYNLVCDVSSNEWVYRELTGFRRACATGMKDYGIRDYVMDSLTWRDGGLVCIGPLHSLLTVPILVGNPLTDEWKVLPCLRAPADVENHIQFQTMQLVVEEDTKCYRVIVVCLWKLANSFAAHCFDSRTGAWSSVESGLVCGSRDFKYWVESVVFDCTYKTMSYVSKRYLSYRGRSYATLKDHVFALHYRWGRDFTISEYVLRSRPSEMDMIHIRTCNKHLIDVNEDYNVHFFACSGFALVFEGKLCEDGRNYRHQVVRVFDSSAHDWHVVSAGDDIKFTRHQLETAFMCELRWDVVP